MPRTEMYVRAMRASKIVNAKWLVFRGHDGGRDFFHPRIVASTRAKLFTS